MHCDSVFSVSGYILTYLLTCVVPESGSDAGDAWRVQVLHYSDTVSASHNEWSPGRPGWYGQDGDHQGPRSRSWHYGLRLQLFGTDGLHGQQQFLPEFVTNFSHTVCFLSASLYFSKRGAYYGRPLSVSGRPCYILPMFFFIYLFFFYGRLILRPWLTEVRENFTRGGPWVSLEKLVLVFFPGHP